MFETQYDFEISLRRPGKGPIIAREGVAPEHLRFLSEDAIWRAQRKGFVGADRSLTRCEIEPVFSKHSGGRVEQLQFHVVEEEAGTNGGAGTVTRLWKRQYSLAILHDASKPLVLKAVREKRLELDDEYEVEILAHEKDIETTAVADRSAVTQKPLSWVEGDLEEWRARSRLLNAESHDPDATPVFILRDAYDAARNFCRAGGAKEGGAMLIGRLYRQSSPEPELFPVIEAAFEARHADQQVFSLSLSPETLLYFEKQLARRRRRLRRPEELELGFAHGHNFLPALDPKTSKPLCPGCDKRPECQLDSAFFSTDDVQFHKAFFNKRVFSVSLVFGLTPREEDKVRFYGFTDGVVKERSLWLAD